MMNQDASVKSLDFSNPVEKIIQIASQRYFKLIDAYEDPEVMNHPAVTARLQWETQICSALTQAATNVVKDLTEPLKAIVNK
jgi:hypothetical protein